MYLTTETQDNFAENYGHYNGRKLFRSHTTIRHQDPRQMVKLIAAAKADEIVRKLGLKERKDIVLLTCDQGGNKIETFLA